MLNDSNSTTTTGVDDAKTPAKNKRRVMFREGLARSIDKDLRERVRNLASGISQREANKIGSLHADNQRLVVEQLEAGATIY